MNKADLIAAIAASKAPKFKAGTKLKDAVNALSQQHGGCGGP